MKKILLAAASASALATAAQADTLTVYTNNFDTPAVTAGGATASGPTNGGAETATTGPWNANGWAGNIFVNRTSSMTELTLSNLPTHTSVDINFLLGFLESWDSRDGGCCSPDELEIYVDGTLLDSLTSNNELGSVEDYGGGTELYDDVQLNVQNQSYDDTLVDMSTAGFLSLAHTGSTLTFGIRMTGAGFQGGGDEGWGIDNLSITLDGVQVNGAIPEPATWAMMISGFGLIGGAMRRRSDRLATA